MATELYETAAEQQQNKPVRGASSIVTGTVTNNIDLVGQGRVQVRIPSLDVEVWARLAAVGGGSDAGFLYVPRNDDEVVVAMSQDNPEDAFVLGGLWSSQDSPPVSTGAEAVVKRVIKTGVEEGLAHEVEFDDLEQSITITSSTNQTVTIDPDKIELSNEAGTLVITLDNLTETVTIKGVNIELDADVSLTLKGPTISIEADPGPLSIKATSSCAINGLPVTIN